MRERMPHQVLPCQTPETARVQLDVAVSEPTVAQIFNLPYRGFTIRTARNAQSTRCRMQFGDTADCKSALRLTATFSRTETAPHSDLLMVNGVLLTIPRMT